MANVLQITPPPDYARYGQLQMMREEQTREQSDRERMRGILSGMQDPEEASQALMQAGFTEEAGKMQDIMSSQLGREATQQEMRMREGAEGRAGKEFDLAQQKYEMDLSNMRFQNIAGKADYAAGQLEGMKDPEQANAFLGRLLADPSLQGDNIPTEMRYFNFKELTDTNVPIPEKIRLLEETRDLALSGIPAEKPPESIRKLETLLKRPDLLALEKELQASGAEKTTISIGGEPEPYSKKFMEEEASADVNMAKELDAAVASAQSQEYLNSRMESILDEGMETGKLADWKLEAKRWATAFNVADFDTKKEEEFRRLANNKAFDELVRFKGPTSERELAFAIKLVGDITTTEGAIRRYLALSNRMMGRVEEQSREMDNYGKKNDGSIRGFREYWRKYQIENPLVSQPKTIDEFDALPEGALYIDPEDGKMFIK